MRKFLRKLIRRIPPFRYIYAQISKLQHENKDLKQQLKKSESNFNKKLSAQKENITALEKQNNRLEKKLEEISKQNAETAQQLVAIEKRMQTKDQQLQKNINSIKGDLNRQIEYYYFKGLQPDQYPDALREWYRNRTGKELNLEHPKTYNEKIQWLKLYDSTPLKTRLADKLLVRDWVAEKIGKQYLIPLLGVYDKFDDIDFDALPDKFVIQTNHASATYRIVTDKTKFDAREARSFFNGKMKINFAFWAGLELQYKNITPKLIVEEYLENNKHQLDDYKVFCFGGKPMYIEYITDRQQGREAKGVFYDTKWGKMPFKSSSLKYELDAPCPDCLNVLLSMAETLSAGFAHVRVDFYILEDGSIRFGEMTFTPNSGRIKWDPPCYDEILGNLISLPDGI